MMSGKHQDTEVKNGKVLMQKNCLQIVTVMLIYQSIKPFTQIYDTPTYDRAEGDYYDKGGSYYGIFRAEERDY